MRRLCVPLLLRTLVFILLLPLVANSQPRTGHVKGFVWFIPYIEEEKLYDRVLIPGVEITFRSAAFEEKAISIAGEFEVDLPSGEYEVTTSFNQGNDYWELHAAKRAVFEVKSDTGIVMNLMVPIKHNAHAVMDGTWGPNYRKELHQEPLDFSKAQRPGHKPLIIFSSKKSLKTMDEYLGKKDKEQDVPAFFSFDTLAIYADKITVDKLKHQVRATGHVIAEDGKTRVRGTEATVDFDLADPIATLKVLKPMPD